jgi:hypothetical protein
MTSKEKAVELVKKFSRFACMGRFECKYERHENAKKIAIISVDEILTLRLDKDQYYEEFDDKINYYSYWNEVKREIQKL